MKRHWIKLIGKMIWLYLTESKTDMLVNKSYNGISDGYDKVWTNHMRDKSVEMIEKLDIKKDTKILDLTCGTGFVTSKLYNKSKSKVVGVDKSEGMLKIAKKNYGKNCDFVKSDVIKFLKTQPKDSYDIITCAWGLGYTKPYKLIKESIRILKKGGKLAIIDNTLFTIKEAIWSSILSIAEKPDSLEHMFNVNFLPLLKSLEIRMKIAGFLIEDSWKGEKTYYVKNGKEAVEKLVATGAFAGLEFCYSENGQDELQKKFIRNIENKYKTNKEIPITHRYIAAIGTKK